MSLAVPATRPAESRAEIVAALDAVDGVTAYRSAPDQATPGAAWPKWVQSVYNGPLCSLAVDTFEVLVTLPAGMAIETVDRGDGLRDVVAFELARVGHVEFVEPASITFQDRQAMPGLRFRMTIE